MLDLTNLDDDSNISIVGPASTPTADFLPDISWAPAHQSRGKWRVSHSGDAVEIYQGNNVIRVSTGDLPAFVAELRRIGG
jgi:hypothetical protein